MATATVQQSKLTQNEQVRSSAYSAHMDMARGVAALVVMLAHQHILFLSTPHSAKGKNEAAFLNHDAHALGMGHYAVVVFFVLSGFLVGGSTIRALKQKSFSWPRYLTHRLVRLWIVLIPALLVGAVIDSIGLHLFPALYHAGRFTSGLPANLNLETFLGNVLFLQNLMWFHVPRFGSNDALWSLSNEFWYYVAFPVFALIFAGRRKGRRKMLMFGSQVFFERRNKITVLYGVLSVVVIAIMLPTVAAYFSIWLLGCAVFVLPKRIPERLQFAALTASVTAFLLLLGILRKFPLADFTTDLVIGLGFSVVLYIILHRTGSVGRSYGAVAHFVSRPSYTLYLFHLPISVFVGAWLQSHGCARPTYAAASSVLVFACCYGLYFCFEAHTERLRRFIEQKIAT